MTTWRDVLWHSSAWRKKVFDTWPSTNILFVKSWNAGRVFNLSLCKWKNSESLGKFQHVRSHLNEILFQRHKWNFFFHFHRITTRSEFRLHSTFSNEIKSISCYADTISSGKKMAINQNRLRSCCFQKKVAGWIRTKAKQNCPWLSPFWWPTGQVFVRPPFPKDFAQKGRKCLPKFLSCRL